MMLVVDEYAGLGYWATDRNAGDGDVTVFTFIPAFDARVNYSADRPDISDLAYITSVKATWPEGFDARAASFGEAAAYAYETYGLTPVFVAVEKHLDPGAGQLAARGLDIPHYFLDDAGGAGTIIGALSRMEVVVSMRLHALIFAAGQGIPLAGVVYDPKVSAFLRYIGQEVFTDLNALTEENLRTMIDQAVAQTAHPDAQAAAVERLQAMEQRNVEVARRLLGK